MWLFNSQVYGKLRNLLCGGGNWGFGLLCKGGGDHHVLIHQLLVGDVHQVVSEGDWRHVSHLISMFGFKLLICTLVVSGVELGPVSVLLQMGMLDYQCNGHLLNLCGGGLEGSGLLCDEGVRQSIRGTSFIAEDWITCRIKKIENILKSNPSSFTWILLLLISGNRSCLVRFVEATRLEWLLSVNIASYSLSVKFKSSSENKSSAGDCWLQLGRSDLMSSNEAEREEQGCN